MASIAKDTADASRPPKPGSTRTTPVSESRYVLPFDEIGSDDVARVGGKNASLGEMIRELGAEGIQVPGGFATTAEAYRTFLDENDLAAPLEGLLGEMHAGRKSLEDTGTEIRRLVAEGRIPDAVRSAILEGYQALGARYEQQEPSVAVRSSATAEDLPRASFAGQLETYLNVRGEEALLEAWRQCVASLFTDRAISYREDRDFGHMEISLSAGVQKMVRSDLASAGVMFTLDTETGFPRVVIIDAAWGLGENVVKGQVNPDQYTVFKPLLERAETTPIVEKRRGDKASKIVYGDGGSGTKEVPTPEPEQTPWCLDDAEIVQLARWGAVIEEHYGRPMDIEWAKDGETGELFVVQARPETVQARKEGGQVRTYTLRESGKALASGAAVGSSIASGPVRVIHDPSEGGDFEQGDILVTGQTDPAWGPILRRAAAIVTDTGGRTSHAAIVSREMGIPAVVGTGDATSVLPAGEPVTVSCAEGEEGRVYEGTLSFDSEEVDLRKLPDTRTRILVNVANPGAAFRWWELPVRGVGLARVEFTIGEVIGVHPVALARLDEVRDPETKAAIRERLRGWEDGEEYFVSHLAWGIAKVAASRHPDPVIVRTSDFKTNEYAALLGGEAFEPRENNPMLGFRGASRYYSDRYRPGFALECRALRRVREEMGLDNVVVMIPFCRTPEEADLVLEVMAEEGLERGRNGLEVYVMAEVPSNVVMAEEFARRFDGFSIGSNDLTQLLLGVDRDSRELAELFDERHPAVRRTVAELIQRAHETGTPVGICGQAPSDYPDFAAFLVEQEIDSISLNPDSVVQVIRRVSEVEKSLEDRPGPTSPQRGRGRSSPTVPEGEVVTVETVMTRDVVTLEPGATLREAIGVLTGQGVSGAPVLQGDDVVGVLSVTDLLELQEGLPGVPTERREMLEWGAWDVGRDEIPGETDEPWGAYWVDLWEDAGAEVFTRISETEGPEWDALDEHTVEEAMSRRILSVRPETPLRDAARFMVRMGVHRLLVTRQGRLLGVVSASDVVRAMAEDLA